MFVGFLGFGFELVTLGGNGGDFGGGPFGVGGQADRFRAGLLELLFGGAPGLAGALFGGTGFAFGSFGSGSGDSGGIGGIASRDAAGFQGGKPIALGQAHRGLRSRASAHGVPIPAPDGTGARDQDLAGGEVALQDVAIRAFGPPVR
jgi:hypothetical protein